MGEMAPPRTCFLVPCHQDPTLGSKPLCGQNYRLRDDLTFDAFEVTCERCLEKMPDLLIKKMAMEQH